MHSIIPIMKINLDKTNFPKCRSALSRPHFLFYSNIVVKLRNRAHISIISIQFIMITKSTTHFTFNFYDKSFLRRVIFFVLTRFDLLYFVNVKPFQKIPHFTQKYRILNRNNKGTASSFEVKTCVTRRFSNRRSNSRKHRNFN